MENINSGSLTRRNETADKMADEALAEQLKLARYADASLRGEQSRALSDFYVGQQRRSDFLLAKGDDVFAASIRGTRALKDRAAEAHFKGIREEEEALAPLDWRKIAEMTPEEVSSMLERESLVQGALAMPTKPRFDQLDCLRRDTASASRVEWDQLSSATGHYQEVFQQKVEGLREALAQSEQMTQRQMMFWERVIDKALAVRERLEDIAKSAQDRCLAAADAALKRELEEKRQALETYLAKTKARIEENRAMNQELRVGEKERHEQRLMTQQQEDEAALKEMEAYVKNKLTGRGRYYRFTRDAT